MRTVGTSRERARRSRVGLGSIALAVLLMATQVAADPQPPGAPAKLRRDLQRGVVGDYHALVIGIDHYTALPPLTTAVRDARAIAILLGSTYGYQTRLLIDPTRDEIVASLTALRSELGEHDNLLIYFAGRGQLGPAAGAGHWLPVDATAEPDDRWLSHAQVTAAIRALRARHVMVIADSCYADKLAEGLPAVRRGPDHHDRMAARRTRVVLDSGGLAPRKGPPHSGAHSVFATALLDVLAANLGVMDGRELFSRVRHAIGEGADRAPDYAEIRSAGHEGGDFLFLRR